MAAPPTAVETLHENAESAIQVAGVSSHEAYRPPISEDVQDIIQFLRTGYWEGGTPELETPFTRKNKEYGPERLSILWDEFRNGCSGILFNTLSGVLAGREEHNLLLKAYYGTKIKVCLMRRPEVDQARTACPGTPQVEEHEHNETCKIVGIVSLVQQSLVDVPAQLRKHIQAVMFTLCQWPEAGSPALLPLYILEVKNAITNSCSCNESSQLATDMATASLALWRFFKELRPDQEPNHVQTTVYGAMVHSNRITFYVMWIEPLWTENSPILKSEPRFTIIWRRLKTDF